MTRTHLLAGLTVTLAFLSIAASFAAETYSQASAAANSQPVNSQTELYMSSWDDYNNSHKLDEKEGCYFKAQGPTRQILVIDASGTVIQFLSDADNARTRCFKHSYLRVQFPKPPFAPYYVRMDMQ